MDKKLYMRFDAVSENEAFARSAVASFVLSLDPTVEEINDVKTAVSEAVTNSVVHAYKEGGEVEVRVKVFGKTAVIEISDKGVGISDIHAAMKPFYTTKPDEERAGLGFAVMQALCDKVEVAKNEPSGLIVRLTKTIG